MNETWEFEVKTFLYCDKYLLQTPDGLLKVLITHINLYFRFEGYQRIHYDLLETFEKFTMTA